MYLASFELKNWPLYQAGVQMGPLPPVADNVRDTWWQRFAQQLSLVQCSAGAQWALRVTLDDRGWLNRALVATSPQRDSLRKCMAAFTALEGVVEGSVSLPVHRQEYDSLLERFPPLQCRIEGDGYRLPNVWFACDFRLASRLSTLLAEAEMYGYALGYQAHLGRVPIEPRWIAEARKNAMRVGGLRGVSSDVVQMQERLATGLAGASFIAEEYVGVESPQAAQWLQSALRREFQRSHGRLGFDLPSFELRPHEHDDLLSAALHSSTFVEHSLDELCGAAVNEADAASILSWRPADDFAARCAARMAPPLPPAVTVTVLPTVPSAAGTAVELPLPYTGDGPFVFISYKRGDEPRFAPILRQMISLGLNIWYDRGIPGGSEWDATLEERITNCQFVLLFVSESAINSKYVRREAKFADALNKPILSIVLEDTQLSGGMHMLLTQYQMLNRGAPDFERQLREAAAFITRLADSAAE